MVSSNCSYNNVCLIIISYFCSDLSNNPLVCDCNLTRLYLLLNCKSKLGNAGARCNDTATFVKNTDNKFVNCTGNKNIDTVEPALVVTSIKQSHVLTGHVFLLLS